MANLPNPFTSKGEYNAISNVNFDLKTHKKTHKK